MLDFSQAGKIDDIQGRPCKLLEFLQTAGEYIAVHRWAYILLDFLLRAGNNNALHKGVNTYVAWVFTKSRRK